MNHPLRCRCGTLRGQVSLEDPPRTLGAPVVAPKVLTRVQREQLMAAVLR